MLYTLSSILCLLKKSFNIWYSKSFHLAVVLQELVALLGQLFFHVHFKNSLSVFSPKLKKQTGWAWFDHDSVGHLERISVIILGLLIHEHVICLSLSPFNVLIKFYNHQRDPEHCMYKYIYSFLCKSYFRCYIYIYTHMYILSVPEWGFATFYLKKILNLQKSLKK